jgi:alpha-D-ribose 1-methylphosphonate 5-triphosphate synthase subunit PhnI
MGYVAIKGGEDAIAQSIRLVEYYRVRGRTAPVSIGQIQGQFRLLLDKIMGEASLYAPEHAALVLKQNEGDVFESAFMLRAYRATLQRRYTSETLATREMFIRRRLSSAFREIPGGQILGPTRDYSQRLLDGRLATETLGHIEDFLAQFEAAAPDRPAVPVTTLPKVIDLLQAQGLLREVDDGASRRVVDVTREAVKFPAPRSAALQMLARAETGGLMALAYSAQRGFGSTHATVGELRVGEVPVRVRDARGRIRVLGRIRLTEAEMISRLRVQRRDESPALSLGYGLCFGQNETKAIAMGILDRAMRSGGDAPCQSQEFVLYHTEGIESYGFTNHLKLPHYVTFQSSLSNLRQAIERKDRKRGQLGFGAAAVTTTPSPS